jgi:diguanylate cyclase
MHATQPDQAALLFIDLDDFRQVNDTLGHEAGDRLLVTVAERMRAAVGPGDLAARLGGDEFAVLLVGSAAADRVDGVASRLLASLHDPVELPGGRLVAGGSIGVAIGADGLAAEQLLRRADVAMYEAKTRAKGSLQVWTAERSPRSPEPPKRTDGMSRPGWSEALTLR